ncbi:MAG TPA: hypothetical protein VFU43_29300 [Streptosporangiaceae bacterium]|nr:hypothetical protein [Streptosporangiaceae bacterium]
MPRNRILRWSIWVASCALAAVSVAIAIKTLPLTSQSRAKTGKGQQAAALRGAPQRPAPGPAPQTLSNKAARLPQHIALGTLRLNGIRWRSNGHCSNRYRPSCTSLQGIRRVSIEGLISFRRHSRCRIIVSGGTERGHAPGRFSHWNGYKIDVLPNRCVNRFITKRLRHVGVRGDGAALYRSRSGGVYADEGSHWDLLYR